MNNYNFGELLSPLRFEQISRDLLSEEYGIFENFAEGKDKGIDFRYSSSDNNVLIVQCKRYKTVSSLINTLKKEKEKIKQLDFSTYLLVTSLSLTGTNKEKIVNILENKIEEKHIITKDDLNYLLGKPSNHYIEFKYPELWMKSINIHQKIFHLGFLQHSKFISDKVLASLINFVPFKQYDEVITHFERSNIVIISGNPGIGKTTLSHAVAAHYIYFKKYKLIDLSYRKIQEAEAFLYQDEPTIFFIDDFLGKIKLNKTNDYTELLLFFIEKIENTKNKKLIIASREYILRQANKQLFSVHEINQTVSKYVIELKSFTRSVRTEILFNYVKSSELPVTYISNLLQSDVIKIIDHKNYNPRIIEELTNINLIKSIEAENYFSFFIDNLKNPLKVWKRVYDNLPNKLYKLVIITKFLIEEDLPVKHLEKAINSIIKESKEYHHFGYDEFEYVMKELEGTFFIFKDGYDELIEEEYTLVDFQTTSIIDFIDNFIWEKHSWLNLIIKNAIYFEQLFNWELEEVISNSSELSASFRAKILIDFHNLTNASIGYFEYDTEETSFDCWAQGRYYYYLQRLLDVVDIYEDAEVANFLTKEIFRYPFDGTESISEKQSFCEIASILIELKYIKDTDAIKHYTSGFFNNIKELVCFEYMTRKCSKKALKLIKKNKRLAQEVDDLFLEEIEMIGEKDFIDFLDFFDDYEQIKYILPLPKTTEKLKELETGNLLKASYERLGKEIEIVQNMEKNKKDNGYFDIDDKSISDLFETINDEK